MGTINRRPWESATTLDQALLDECADNLEINLEMAADIETPSDPIYASDRNKYVGGTFYEALTRFPAIKRTIGEWLSPTIQFSPLSIGLSNVDGRFNNLLPSGDDFNGWIGKSINVRLGLSELSATYFSIFQGILTDIGGFGRQREQINLVFRDQFDKINQKFPNTTLQKSSFPDLEDNYVGDIVPYIYGDWTQVLNEEFNASIPGVPVNGANVDVLAGTESVQIIVSENVNFTFDNTSFVVKKRNGDIINFSSGDITDLLEKRIFAIKQSGNGGSTSYVYESGDKFYCRLRGKDLGAYSDNPVEQARDILKTFGGLVDGDFDTSWNTLRDKNTPSNLENSISTIESRAWVKDDQTAVEYALSLLEQVRLEAFVDRNLKWKLTSLHFDDFPAPANIDFTIKNWDLAVDTFNPKLDERNVWNRAQSDYAFDPVINKQGRQTGIYKNQAAIDQAGKTISKKIEFPNLYTEEDVINQTKEMIKLASSYSEFIDATITWRGAALDIGDFIKVGVNFGGTVYDNTPAMIREIGYNPDGSIPIRLWSFQMTPYNNFNPSYAGIVGGSTATIVQE
jgi:hypothetical protein